MCGIAGFYGFENKKLLRQMSKDMEHRGPDGEGFFEHDVVNLLSRRLAIIDRKGGDQPIYNEDKTVAVVYNGEIYNYQELREELQKKGHVFQTKSDTEVIVHMYEEEGPKGFARFNGMFGFAIYDYKKKQVIVARDHFGIKPLYYNVINPSSKDFQVIFASEIKPLLHSGLVPKKVNERILYRYLKYRIHDDNEETFFDGIYRLMPGEYMTITAHGMTKEYFCNLEKELASINEHDFTDADYKEFEKRFTDAVRMRLISEVPVGTCLSGGLDSSAVAAVSNILLKEKVKEASSLGVKQNTFSAVFPGSTNDEEKYVDAATSRLDKVSVHKIYPKPEEFFSEIMDFVKTQEEPTISTGPYAQYQVMREAHKFVTVLLDGQGSDEMMAGYIPYYFVYLNELKKQGKYGTYLNELFASRDILWKFFVRKLLYALKIKRVVPVSSILDARFSSKYPTERFPVTSDNLKARLIEDIFHNSLPSLLRYEDKNSMRFSIEGRVPFLDFNLLRYIFSLSNDAIIKGSWNKNILRGSMQKILPEMIARRRNKIGFTTPEYEWFLRMKNRIYSIFLSESFANRPYFNQAAVLKAFEEFIQGKNDDTLVFWRLLNVELWLRTFFDEPAKEEVTKEKGFFEPNQGKNLELDVEGKKFLRFPIRTHAVQKGEKIENVIEKYVSLFWKNANETKGILKSHLAQKNLASLGTSKWSVIISEKIVAISQGRSYFIWDIKPSFFANVLSKFVRRTPYGIGLGSPWTMQLAISEVGLPRILLAAVASVVTKPFGIKGVFYQIAGREAASIDGPTEYSLYPSNVSAKLGPKDPDKAAAQIKKKIEETLPKKITEHFQGVVIIDSNDLGRTVLGNASTYTASYAESLFKDNPLGQAAEQTPMAVVFEE